MKTSKTLLLTLIFSLVWIGVVQAVPINNSYLFQNKKVIDFSTLGFYRGQGPIQVGTPNDDNIIWSSGYYHSVIKTKDGGGGTTGFLDNGAWDYDMDGFISLNTGRGTMAFKFTEPLKAVGGFLNEYRRYSYPYPAYISVFNIQGKTLETLYPSINTFNGVNAGEFWGFAREENDIYGFRLSNAGISIDNLTYSKVYNPVPEPATMLLFGTGIVGLVGAKLRKRRYNHGK